jgi:putative molybdopterin biosynthesis protein
MMRDRTTTLAGRRKSLDITQSELAKTCGISRQFIGLLEIGKVQPNVQVALKLAEALNTTVEELFSPEEATENEIEVVCAMENMQDGSRVNVAKVGGIWVAHQADTMDTIGGGFNPADGVLRLSKDKAFVTCRASLEEIEGNVIFAGCDPALHLLCNEKFDVRGRNIWINCGSGQAIRLLAEGRIHVAGLHYGFDDGDENLRVVKSAFPDGRMFMMRFSSWEQGWLLGDRVPENFCGVHDLVTRGLRIANREKGAAVRRWLDEELARLSIDSAKIRGYDICHLSHTEAVESILAGRADLMLGPCVMAGIFGLRFIPIGRVAFDLVFDKALFDNERMDACIKWLSSRRFHREISALPGYYS